MKETVAASTCFRISSSSSNVTSWPVGRLNSRFNSPCRPTRLFSSSFFSLRSDNSKDSNRELSSSEMFPLFCCSLVACISSPRDSISLSYIPMERVEKQISTKVRFSSLRKVRNTSSNWYSVISLFPLSSRTRLLRCPARLITCSISAVASPSFPISKYLPFSRLYTFCSNEMTGFSNNRACVTCAWAISMLYLSAISDRLRSRNIFSASFSDNCKAVVSCACRNP